jgi:hypothetical protein
LEKLQECKENGGQSVESLQATLAGERSKVGRRRQPPLGRATGV